MKKKDLEQVVTEVAKDSNIQYRDEMGVRIQAYRRFKQNVDYIPADCDTMIAMVDVELQKRKQGRPPKIATIEELDGAIMAYWQYIKDCAERGVALIPDVEGLASFMRISRETLNEWERSNYRGFSATIKEAKNAIASMNKQLAKQGKIPPIVFATDFNNNHGYTQKQEIQLAPPQDPLASVTDPEERRKRIEAAVIEED